MISGGISTGTLLEKTRLLQKAAREAGAMLQAVVCDDGAANHGHHMALQELLLEAPDAATVPIFDQGHVIRNILVGLRNGKQYTCGGILFLLLILNSNRKFLGVQFSFQCIMESPSLFPHLR
jgi:hypothetical protein